MIRKNIIKLCYFSKELLEAWERLKSLSLKRQEKLFGAHEIQHFNRYSHDSLMFFNMPFKILLFIYLLKKIMKLNIIAIVLLEMLLRLLLGSLRKIPCFLPMTMDVI